MKKIAAIILLLFCSGANAEPLIFDSSTLLQIEMHFDFSAICMNPEKIECEDVAGQIVYRNAGGEDERVDIRIRTRGRWRPETTNCDLPSLFVFFDERQAEGTIFEGQTMLPLTTHCRHHYRNYQDYVQIEYLAHQIYQMLTDVSLRTRLLAVTYKNSGSATKRTRYAFFVEHFDSLAARTEKTRVEMDDLDVNRVRPREMALFSVFQFMIGNLDWSAVKSHNVVLFEDAEGVMSPVPFDFDFSGIVYTPYAKPPSELPVYSVLSRHYRGFCWPDLDWDSVFRSYNDIRPHVFTALEELPRLSGKPRRRVRRFLNGFYEILDSETKRREDIVEACREIPAKWWRASPQIEPQHPSP